MVRQEQNSLNYFGARYLDPMLGMWISVDPARQFASPYLYVGNGVNPVNGVDGDGNVLLFAPGSSPKFKAEFARAIKYLNNGKSSAIIANLHKRKEVVYVREVSEAAGDEDGFIRKDEDLNAPTIDWDPYSALTFGDGLSQSPALGFLHEADHALGYLKDPDGFNARSLESDIEYDDQEEMRVIQGSETSAAKNLVKEFVMGMVVILKLLIILMKGNEFWVPLKITPKPLFTNKLTFTIFNLVTKRGFLYGPAQLFRPERQT